MFNKAKQFIQDVQVEMKKVVWPEREQLINSTVVVLVITALFTIFIFLSDTIISRIVNILY
jgi:preprotein translocase subunit SecE